MSMPEKRAQRLDFLTTQEKNEKLLTQSFREHAAGHQV